jgi:hypothetical protein
MNPETHRKHYPLIPSFHLCFPNLQNMINNLVCSVIHPYLHVFHVFVYVWVQLYTHICTWRLEVDTGCFLQLFSTLFFIKLFPFLVPPHRVLHSILLYLGFWDRAFYWTLSSIIGETSILLGSSFLHLTGARITAQGCAPHRLFIWVLGLELFP